MNWKDNYWYKRKNELYDFKLGDRIKIIEKAESMEGWNLFWVPLMNDTVGKVGKVIEISKGFNALRVELDKKTKEEKNWWYPPHVLEKVD